MNKSFVFSSVLLAAGVAAADVAVKGPDGRLEFRLRTENGAPQWSAAYDGRSVAEWSPLGLVTEYGDFTKDVRLGAAKKGRFRDAYSLPQGKRSKVKVAMNMATVPLLAGSAKLGFEVRVGNNDLAFRYFVEKATTVRREATGFAFASGAKMFATQQSKPMTGFAQTKPSYEETYVYDAELGTKSGSGEGWTFPMLMRLPGDGGTKDLWALVSETGTDGNYCGCRLADWEGGCFRIAFPMPGEARGKGSVEPKCAAKTSTPWRTLTVGDSLAPIVETTIAYDVVKPVVPAPKKPYEFGRGSWSWIVWDDASMNAADQRKFIDLAAEMGWEHILIDAFWDRIPAEEFDALLAYAKERKVAVYLWYNSNGDWNDAPQTPKNRFVTRESTEREMAWLESKGVRGVKVDFWGGDKQFVIAKYCELFEIANRHHIQVIVHGSTLPRGWERMYPNFVGAEALLASENAKFSDWGMGSTPQWAATHPFCRNAVAVAEYGPVFLNKYLRADNKSGVKRITTDGFELATSVTYQNPVQNFALTPNNLTDAPRESIEFMKKVPTVWDDTRYVAGYPGKFAVIARRSGKTWYVAGVAAEDVETEIDLTFAGGTREKIRIARADGFVRTIADGFAQTVAGCAGRSTSVRNPVIYADCPDPTMCRAGEYVYMVTTTMFFMPGAPVMRSKDMVHWETVSYIFDRFDFGPQYSLEDGKSAYGAGQWATSLVHHNGKFYAWFIANGSGGFVYVADRPEGPWKLLTRAPHLHDCSILFDDDGRVYGFHGSGRVTELEPDFSAVKKGGLDRQLFERGEETALLEGSAAFKKDGYYYLMMVSAFLPGHVRREVCYRSRLLTGEWEKKVILETEFESYGGVGQGCVVECPDGKWRAMVFQDRGGIGRVPCLMDVTWKDGWPMLGDAEGKIPNDVAKPYPDLSGIAGSDDFGAKSLGLLWQWNHNPLEGAWSLSERPGWLRLKARRPADNIFLARNTLTQRMVAPACFGEIKMDVSKMKNGDHAGLAAFQSDSALLSVVMENGGKRLVMSEQKSVFGNGRQIKNVETVERESVPLTSDVVYMRIRADFRPGQDWAEADWSTDGRSWRRIGARFQLRFDWQRLFVGSRFALFCYSHEPSGGSVDFDYFRLGRDDGADYEAVCGTSRGEVRVSSFSEGSLRVTRGRPVAPELVFDADRKAKIEVERDADATRVRSGDLVAVVSHATGLVRFEDARGRAVLSERRVGEKGVAFDSPSDERLCGLGQFQDGQLDVRNLPRRLTQVNTQISAPFLVSTRGWGLYWHNYSKIEFNECSDEIALVKTGDGKESEVAVTTGSGGAKEKRKGVVLEGTFELGADCECAFMLDSGRDMSRVQYVEIDGDVAVDNENVWLPPTIGFRSALKAGAHKVRVVANANDRTRLVFRPDKRETTFRSDVADGTDYVVYLGAPETAVAHFRADCGGTAALPDWAWGYWHCQERFVTQDDLLKAMRYFKDRGLPLSVIVQDWQWWRSGTWNSMEWDAKRFPDPKGMVDECHKNGVRVMLSVWSKTEGDSEFCRAMKDADAFVPGTPWIDFSKKSAADLYWKWFAERLVSTGVDAWWLDAVEPENDAMHGRTFAMGEGDRYRNIYPLLVNTEADRRMRELRPGETPLVLTRCAFPGQTRTSCVMWSGDVGSTWKDLRTQIVAGLGFASAGFPYWTSDAGGFFRPGDQHANSDYQKRLVRWLQFATFCPIQRIHGFVSDTTPSRYGERTEKLLNDQVRLRERLRPYILNLAKDVVGKNAMMMRPLYDAPRGFETEYMFGPDLLVCPVTADVEEMDVWLPEGAWRDFHTGEEVRGGRVVRAKTPIDRIPVYVRAGAKIPNVPAEML